MNIYHSEAFNQPPKGFIDKSIWLLTTILIACFIILDTSAFISYILFGITISIFILNMIQQKGRFIFRFAPFHFHVLLFSIFCLLSSVWAWVSNFAIEKGITIIEILICMTVLYIYYQTRQSVWELLNSIKWAGYFTTIYTFIFYGPSRILTVLAQSSRLDSEFSNINSVAMFSALAITITTFQIFYNQIFFSAILVIPGIVIVAASGARKALVLAVLGIFLVIISRYLTKDIIKNIIKLTLIIGILFLVLLLLSQLSIFSGITKRMEGLWALITGNGDIDSSALKRADFMNIAFSQFLKNPLLGIGMDNARFVIGQKYGYATYSHNNFTELLCNGGIIGFLIFYSMHLYCITKLFKARNNNDFMTVICLILAVLLLLMDWGTISYYSKSTYFYFMVFFLQIENLKKRN